MPGLAVFYFPWFVSSLLKGNLNIDVLAHCLRGIERKGVISGFSEFADLSPSEMLFWERIILVV